MIAKVRKYDYSDILENFDKFEELSCNVLKMDTVKLMKTMVPEFISRNSQFEILDKII